MINSSPGDACDPESQEAELNNNRLPRSILDRVDLTIGQYGLLGAEKRTAVALSGGKDSFILCLALKDLGYEVLPIVIDMGYESGWSDRVTQAASAMGLQPRVVDVRSTQRRQLFTIGFRREIEHNLEILDSLAGSGANEISPCTSCYNSKVLALQSELEQIGVQTIAFGHHGTDSCASLLKSALMYIDRWDQGNARYKADNIRTLANLFLTEARVGDSGAMIQRIHELVDNHWASTDEPPRQPLVTGSPNEIVRPLFDIFESQIMDISRRLELPVESSGCGHSLSAASFTAREIVHFEVLRPLEKIRDVGFIHSWARNSLNQSGFLKYNARSNRVELLGSEYKPAPGRIDKY
jgi:tRNA(Ile)-lysidine synthase TilS/MesJ